jgi:Cu+-exporting ATPase
MHCAGCVGTVERALRSVPGVAAAHVNLATERATIWPAGDRPAPADALVAAVRKAGYAAAAAKPASHEGDLAVRTGELRSQRRRLVAALVLGAPVLLWHMAVMTFDLAPAWTRGHAGWLTVGALQALLTLAVIAVAAGPMIAGAWRALIHGTANMDVLVTLGTGVTFVGAVFGLATNNHALAMLFESAVMIVLFVGLGKHLEARARGRASQALRALLARTPPTAIRVVGDQTEIVAIDQVRPGDRLRVPPDAPVPVDGTVADGRATIDESLLTGESMPVDRQPGDVVSGGTRVIEGLIEITATATGHDSAAARIGRLVEQAQSTKPAWQRFADRAAGVFVPVVLGLSGATFLGWCLFAGAELTWALERAVAVLVVACPCALGLAIPTAVMVGTARAAEKGVLIRDASALEVAGHVAEVLLDKTGTLTLGRPTLERILPVNGDSRPSPKRKTGDDPHFEGRHADQLLALVAGAEQHSEHPLARAIVAAAADRGLALATPRKLRSRHGGGVSATIAHEGVDHTVVVGSADWLHEQGIEARAASERADALAAEGFSVVHVALDGRAAGLLALADPTHPESRAAVDTLHAQGVHVRLLSGDRHAAVSRLAGELGIRQFESQLKPADKLRRVQELVAAGRRVAMVGDGLNDAPALAAADVGIAIGTGADVAREAADICLVGHSPRLIPEAVRISRAGARIMKQNIAWAIGYNLVMLPLAIFSPLPPALATAAMMLSSISVVLNSLRLRRTV